MYIRICPNLLNSARGSQEVVTCDIKPEHFVRALDNRNHSKFGITKPASTYDSIKDRRHIVESLYWASLNSHNGVG